MHFKMWSTICFNLEQSKILLSGYGLKCMQDISISRSGKQVINRKASDKNALYLDSLTYGKGSSLLKFF